jgi:hypothetical protein
LYVYIKPFLGFELAEILPKNLISQKTPFKDLILEVILSIARSLADASDKQKSVNTTQDSEESDYFLMFSKTMSFLYTALDYSIEIGKFPVGHPSLHTFLGDLYQNSKSNEISLIYKHFLHGKESFTTYYYLKGLFLEDESGIEKDENKEEKNENMSSIVFEFAIVRAILGILILPLSTSLSDSLFQALSLFKVIFFFFFFCLIILHAYFLRILQMIFFQKRFHLMWLNQKME